MGAGGELYGGSMFLPSAATDTPQGSAIQRINDVWGEAGHRARDGHKSLGTPVCKKKYRPFEFRVRRSAGGRAEVAVRRLYGCAAHSGARKAAIARHGEREGWEPFGQWSRGKARAAARGEAARRDAARDRAAACPSVSSASSGGEETSREEARSTSSGEGTASPCAIGDARQQQPWQTLCANGSCNWKVRGKRDDIPSEIEEERLHQAAAKTARIASASS